LSTVPKSEVIPEPWLSFLRDLDAAATQEIRMDCIGGFAVGRKAPREWSSPDGEHGMTQASNHETRKSQRETIIV